MGEKYNEYKQLNLPAIHEEILKYWADHDTFAQSMKERENHTPYVFYEGPPSANGQPGIHHVLARSIKDIFCRYKTLKGYYVSRKAGWDTHGLPVELGVEKTLGITKEDIGKKITIEEYNDACRKEVMKYKDLWDDLTVKMGYWVDLENPYITFDNKYIESVWHLINQLYNKDLLYKGYTIQPFSPAAGTGLSSHELNMPGCYRDVKDTTCIAQFKVKTVQKTTNTPDFFGEKGQISDQVYFLAWTTTPWTLPSNTALAVGPNIQYVLVDTFNPYSGIRIQLIMAKPLLSTLFPEKNAELSFDEYKQGDKNIPFKVMAETKGSNLVGLTYEQLIPWINPGENAFRVIAGDFVTTEDGTGIVHIAPTFGADDDRVAKAAGIAPLILIDNKGFNQPMVDRQGKFFSISDLDTNFVESNVNIDLYQPFAGKFVKSEYDPNPQSESLDVEICVMLKTENKAFKIEKHTHSYPHCWRTDKPILYYPLDSWFIKTTNYKQRMIELNKTINWKPEATGTGRFGNWLENLVDWNLSRSRYWGVPIPIWVSEDKSEKICIGSIGELVSEINRAVDAGIMKTNPFIAFKEGNMSADNYNTVDIHRPYVDDIVLVSATGQPMFREPDLIDVWFDSGAMPYAQLHYPFENKELFEQNYPADFIAEGVDQTRGWFFTLHAIATMLFDSVAYKNVVSNGLVLDKNGNKMSKRLGNAVDPFTTIAKYGPDATRWYMITNAQPWDNLKFDLEGIGEVQRKFFGTLYNTYNFFALYANIDGFNYSEEEITFENRPEIDRWILSELNTLIKEVDLFYEEYEPTKAGRQIQHFVDEFLSNWYVRLSRRRFWKGEYSTDKISAYQTLYTCLITIAKLSSPIAPFFSDKLFIDLNSIAHREACNSVHLSDFPVFDESRIDKKLEERMQLAQKISSMVLSLRKKSAIRVRQPLSRIMIPVVNEAHKAQILKIEHLILHEVNVKSVEYISDSEGALVKNIKPNFKTLGPRFGKLMKPIAAAIVNMNQDQIASLERNGSFELMVENSMQTIELTDVDIFAQDIPGWAVANDGLVTIALDITLNDALYAEGIARDFVNRIQNIRKEQNFDVIDTISIQIVQTPEITDALLNNIDYICSETLASGLTVVENISTNAIEIELAEGLTIKTNVQNNKSKPLN